MYIIMSVYIKTEFKKFETKIIIIFLKRFSFCLWSTKNVYLYSTT